MGTAEQIAEEKKQAKIDEEKIAEAKRIEDEKNGKPVDGEQPVEGETGETKDPKTDDNSGLGAWWILIILAILALVGGAVYFFVFMPKEEDEEFDAEAQVEEEL